MSDYLKQLEAHGDLEAEVIKKTKVHKVLKAIIKLGSIPKEEEFNFKKRSSDLLGKWGGALAADNDGPATAPSAEPAANGVKSEEDEKKSETGKEVEVSATKSEEEKKEASVNIDASVDADAATTNTTNGDGEGDVAMSEADKEVIKDAPAAQAEANSSIEVASGETTTTTSGGVTA